MLSPIWGMMISIRDILGLDLFEIASHKALAMTAMSARNDVGFNIS